MKAASFFPKKKGAFYEDNFGEFHRFKLSLTTDKDTYKPGETVYIRGVLLDSFNHIPFHRVQGKKDIGLTYCRITSPRDEEIKNLKIPHENSVFSFEWKLDENISGGEYNVEIYTKDGEGLPPAQKKITVNKYNPPRFKKELEFLQKGYSEGDLCTAILKVERTEGGFPDPDQCRLEASCRLDGKEFFRSSNLKLNAIGKCEIKFELPKEIEKGEGSLNVAVTEGLTESVSKTLPVILKELDCHIYPEGGELISGVMNGCYAEAFTPSKDPADFEADLVEVNDEDEVTTVLVTKVSTLHEGRAYFQFTPKTGFNYQLRVTHPSGVTKPIDLPKPLDTGMGFYVEKKEEIEFGKCVSVKVYGKGKQGKVGYIGLFKREKEICGHKVEFTSPLDEQEILLDPRVYDGVLRIFMADENFKPVAERLVFVPPKETVDVDIVPDKNVYAPGDHVKLTIRSSHPESVLCVHVSDDSVYKMKEKRERACRLPAQQFFEDELNFLSVSKFGSSMNVGTDFVVQDGKWILFHRDYDIPQQPGCSGRDNAKVVVVYSTDQGKTWLNQTDVAVPNADNPYTQCALVDGGGFYDSETKTWHYLSQCLGASPLGWSAFGKWEANKHNPVVKGGQLFSVECALKGSCDPQNTVDEGTPDIVEKVNGEFYVTFHGYDYKDKRAVRGIAATKDFVTWRMTGDRLPGDVLFTHNDCDNWNISWASGGCVGGGEGSTLVDTDGYTKYMLIEAPDISLTCITSLGTQNWVLGLLKSSNKTGWVGTGHWTEFQPNPAVVPWRKQGCAIQYHRLFRDSEGYYLSYWVFGDGDDYGMQIWKFVDGQGPIPIVADPDAREV